MTRPKSVIALEENAPEVYLESTEVLIRVARNILKEPSNPKYRSISLGSNVVTNKLLPVSGAIECLFEMGFQEGEDKLILPQESSLENVRKIHDELLRGRELQTAKKSTNTKSKEPSATSECVTNQPSTSKSTNTSIISKKLHDLLISYGNHEFLQRIIVLSMDVLKYENKKTQLKALKCVPLIQLYLNVEKTVRKIQLAIKKKEIEDQVIDYQELLLIELLNWFKNDFFQWVDTLPCQKCKDVKTIFVGNSSMNVQGAKRVELFRCPNCNTEEIFPRYEDVEKLLITRKGRCGEWADCFSLICRSLGWDVRRVADETDHVWTEVYSETKKKWLHCDPCENVIDKPLMYECGWEKKLSYILAYSKDGVQDVTWRYSCKHDDVLKNRNQCREEELVEVILRVRDIMLSDVSKTRRNYVIKRTALELVDLLKQGSPDDCEKQGRSSGSLAWRLARGEIKSSHEKFTPHTWDLEKDMNNSKFMLSYCSSRDEYNVGLGKRRISGWENGAHDVKSIFRKEEKDWKFCYLARNEGSENGSITWRFHSGSKHVITKIEVLLSSTVFETGNVFCKLCAGDSCIRIPNDNKMLSTDALSGSNCVDLVVELSGGKGNEAWQHAQLFRQAINCNDDSFTIVMHMKAI